MGKSLSKAIKSNTQNLCISPLKKIKERDNKNLQNTIYVHYNYAHRHSKNQITLLSLNTINMFVTN
jgi:hypothetical protein